MDEIINEVEIIHLVSSNLNKRSQDFLTKLNSKKMNKNLCYINFLKTLALDFEN
jgi:DNA-directed RNA polymerase